MRQLTPEEREALFADMRSFFEQDSADETFNDDEALNDENIALGNDQIGDSVFSPNCIGTKRLMNVVMMA